MDVLEAIDGLKGALDELRPLPPGVLAQVEQKLRLETNYHSNAIEGNTLTIGETRNLILHGLTAHGKPMRDHLDVEGHDAAVRAIEDAIRENEALNEVFIRNLHRVLLKEPYKMEAIAPDGRDVLRTIAVGEYKTAPNNVRTSTGEIYYFTPPEQVKAAMSDLIDWYRAKEQENEHPVIIAATFHYRFVRIHPFDDGNGRMARLLMNMILIKHGYTIALIRLEQRGEYIATIERAGQTDNLIEFISYIASCCEYSLNLHLRAARGESIEDVGDIDKEIALFKKSLANASDAAPFDKEYLAHVVYPFNEYCQGRVRLFSDVFGRVQTRISFFTTSADGQVITICEDAPSLPSLSGGATLPDQLRSISFNSSTYFTTFQGGQDNHVLLTVKNSVDSDQCLWTFSLGALRFEREYAGRDLGELKKHLNETMRAMMARLSERGGD